MLEKEAGGGRLITRSENRWGRGWKPGEARAACGVRREMWRGRAAAGRLGEEGLGIPLLCK